MPFQVFAFFSKFYLLLTNLYEKLSVDGKNSQLEQVIFRFYILKKWVRIYSKRMAGTLSITNSAVMESFFYSKICSLTGVNNNPFNKIIYLLQNIFLVARLSSLVHELPVVQWLIFSPTCYYG
jgi:hypothetical protein